VQLCLCWRKMPSRLKLLQLLQPPLRLRQLQLLRQPPLRQMPLRLLPLLLRQPLRLLHRPHR